MSTTEILTEENALEPVKFTLIPAEICFEWLAEQVRQSRERAIVQAMSISYDDKTEPIFDALQQAARSGVQARMIADGHSLIFADADPKFVPNPAGIAAWEKIARFRAAVTELGKAGVQTAILNPYGKTGSGWLRWVPYANRNHIKGHVADDLVTIAGPNVTAGAAERYDFMLATESKRLADFWDSFTRFEAHHGKVPGAQDYAVPIDAESQFLVDVGRHGESLIYDTACAWLEADDVAQVYFVSQFFPTGKILEHFESLQQELGTDNVQVLTTRASQFEQPVRISQWRRQRGTYLKFFTTQGERTVHTKVLIVTKTDGSRQGIITSHNFDERGVKYGTEETALVTVNNETLDTVTAYCESIPKYPYGG